MSKSIVFLLALLIPFTLTGCGGDWESVSGSGSEAPPTDGTTPEDPTPPSDAPAADVAGTYSGQSTVRVLVAGEKGSDTRSFKIVITESGSVTVSDSSGRVSGSLSGNRVSANVPAKISQSGLSCSGSVKMSGIITSGVIRGTISGTIPCNGGLKAAVTGTFSARKQ